VTRWVAALDERWVAAAAVFAIAISVYGATMLRGVSSFDPAEMQTVPSVLGIAHPTGYPLWTLLGFFWTRLPLASPALLMNVLSASFFALAAATLALISMRLEVRPTLAAVAGLTFAFAGETWARATQAEAHSLHTLLMALLLLAWIVAEQTESPRAATAMILLVSIGLTHHRLMAISGLPLLLWYFARHPKTVRSLTFAFDATLAGLTPLLLYFYLPIRISENPPVVNADTSGGSIPIIRGTLLASHEQPFQRASPARWWHTLPYFGDQAVRWLGWVVVALALAGALQLALRRRALFLGLALVVIATTYGLANRTEHDDRWLLIPILVACMCAAVALEAVMRIIVSTFQRVDKRVLLLAPAVAALIPLYAVATHYSAHDRSGDTRDQVNGETILSAMAPGAVVWSYWDVRATLEYLTQVKHFRPDVQVLDDRTYAKYKSYDDGTVAIDIGLDPSFAARPYYYIPVFDFHRAAVAQRFRLKPIAPIDLPFGYDDRGRGWLYLVER
jgi:hypothetical protein